MHNHGRMASFPNGRSSAVEWNNQSFGVVKSDPALTPEQEAFI